MPRADDDDDRTRAPTDQRLALLLLGEGSITPAAAARVLDQPRGSVSRAAGRLRADGLVATPGGGSAYVLTVSGHRYARRLLRERAGSEAVD